MLESVKKYGKDNFSDAYRVKRSVWSGGAEGDGQARLATCELLSAAAGDTVAATHIIHRRSV